jgi:TetR/AcrR family transcriptional regulator
MRSSSSKASRREREIERHRTEIMAAAEQLFAQKGYVSSSMDEVARRAEFSVGTLYNFFKNKEALYSAILQHKSELMQVRIEACLARPGSPAERIEAYFKERMELYWRYPNFFRLFFHQAMSAVSDPRAGFTGELADRYELLLRGLDAIFDAGIARGEFRPVSATILTTSLEAIIRGYLVRLSRDTQAVRSKEEEAALFEVFASGAMTQSPAEREAAVSGGGP